MITPELQKTLDKTVQEAATRDHEYVTLEHLLYALLEEPTGSEVIRNCGGDIDELKRELETYLRENVESLPPGMQDAPQPTAAFERALSRAFMQAQASHQVTMDSGNLIAAMFQEKRSHAVYLLEKQGITRLDVLNYISHGISKAEGEEELAPEPG